MNLRSISWSERIGRGALAGIVLCGSVANAQSPAPRAGCANGSGDHCVANPNTYGFYETRWRRWPEVTAALEPVPAKAPVEKPATKSAAPEKPSEKPDERFPKSRTRPPVDENPPEPPRSPQTQLEDLERDLPPKFNPPPSTPDEPMTPAEPITPIERPAAPPRESPVEPPPAEPTPPPRTEPEAAPPIPPRDDLPQPSMNDDLRRFLQEPKAPAKDGKATPKQPEANPPTKDTIRENPFRDDPLLPGENPPPEPRQGRRPAPSPPRDPDMGAVEKSNLQWGFDELEQVRAAAPAAMFRVDSPRELAPGEPAGQPTIEITDASPTDRPIQNALREANGSLPKGVNPLRRGAPSKLHGIDTSSADQVQQTSEAPVAGRAFANPLR